MAYNESDDINEVDILAEIALIKEELSTLGHKSADISMREKMLRHRLYDLEYELNHNKM